MGRMRWGFEGLYQYSLCYSVRVLISIPVATDAIRSREAPVHFFMLRQVTIPVPIYIHVIRKQRIQAHVAVFPAADDLAVAVAVQQQVGQHDFPENKGRLFRARFIMEQAA